MKTDYLIAFFAIAGTGLGSPITPEDLIPRDESASTMADTALIKDFCVSSPAITSEEDRAVCNSAAEPVKRRVHPAFPNGPFCSRLPPNAPPVFKAACKKAKKPKRDADVEESAEDTLLVRTPQSSSEEEAGSDDSAVAAAADAEPERRSDLDSETVDSLGAWCRHLTPNAPDAWKRMCAWLKVPRNSKRSDENADATYNKVGMTKGSALTPNSEATFARKKRAGRGLRLIVAQCHHLSADAPDSIKRKCARLGIPASSKRSSEDVDVADDGTGLAKRDAAGDDEGDEGPEAGSESEKRSIPGHNIITWTIRRCRHPPPNASDSFKEGCARLGFPTSSKRSDVDEEAVFADKLAAGETEVEDVSAAAQPEKRRLANPFRLVVARCTNLPASAPETVKTFCRSHGFNVSRKRSPEESVEAVVDDMAGAAADEGEAVAQGGAVERRDNEGADEGDQHSVTKRAPPFPKALFKLGKTRCSQLKPSSSPQLKHFCQSLGFKANGKRDEEADEEEALKKFCKSRNGGRPGPFKHFCK